MNTMVGWLPLLPASQPASISNKEGFSSRPAAVTKLTK
jgi:hypothetical protein